jgi:hypothetical protein
VSHAKKVTIAAAAVAVLGAALSLAAGSALNVENASTQAADPAGAGSSVTSVSIHTVPSPISAQQLPPAQPLAVQPPPPLPPPTDAMPASAEPLSAAATSEPEPAAIPVPHQTVSALPSVTPTAAAPLAAATAQSPAAPIAVPPAAPAPMAGPPVAVPAPTEPADAPPPDPVQVVLSPLFSGLP